jgi:flagellar motility protein MotE (MotC chaperone)
MNNVLKLTLLAAGSSAGFVGAFTGFSLALGAPIHEIAIVGSLFPAPPGEETATAGPTPAPVPAVERRPLRKAGIGVLDVFQIESPFTSSELSELAETLENKLHEVDQRLLEVAERERRAADRAQFLDEQHAALVGLRTGLETWEDELDQREAEVERDEAARAARTTESWVRLAKLFEKGDAAEQSTRLAAYTPDEVARILHQLKPTRAQELLDSFDPQRWKDYAEAYRTAAPRE